jgi:hypothetical protein
VSKQLGRLTFPLMVVAGCSSLEAVEHSVEDIITIEEPTVVENLPVLTCPKELPESYAQDERSKGRLVVVYKSLYQLGLYEDGKLVEDNGAPICFHIAMGNKPWGAKVLRDNLSTPEGWYKTASKQDVGSTSFYRGFLINYPNEQDVDRAFETAVISNEVYTSLKASIKAGKTPAQNTIMGGEIMIHGMGASAPTWTAGCVAVENADMDVLFRHLGRGDDVLITPWTERYTRDPLTQALVVHDVPLPRGQSAELQVPMNPDWFGGTATSDLVQLKIDLDIPEVRLTIP